MQLVASLVSVLLLVWSARATALPGEERLAIQNTRVSIMHPVRELGEVGAHRSRLEPGEGEIRAIRLYLMQTTLPPLYIPRHYSFMHC